MLTIVIWIVNKVKRYLLDTSKVRGGLVCMIYSHLLLVMGLNNSKDKNNVLLLSSHNSLLVTSMMKIQIHIGNE